MAANLKERIAATTRGQPYNLSTTVTAPALPERGGALPERLQDIARSYLGARRQSGVSLLDAARWLSEARAEAKHGEWAIFLEAISLDESRARAQIRIHEEAQRDPVFADRIVNGFLSETVARELLPLPAEKREELLARETPPTREDIRDAKRVPAPVLDQPVAAPDLPPEFAIVQRRLEKHGHELTSSIQGQHRVYAIKRPGMTGIAVFDWSNVLSRLERMEADPNPNLQDMDPAHVESLEEQIEADRIPEASMEIAPVSDRQAHLLKEARDAGRIERARSLIEHGEHAAARTVLDQIEVSTRAADQLRATIPAGRSITLAMHPDDCAALLREARMFSGSELTKRLPAIGQVLALLVEAIKGGA